MPILVWDGECGFCKFWVTRWQQKTADKITFKTYQEIGKDFRDIPFKEFKKASKLIDTSGNVYNGPDSAFRCLYIAGNKKWHLWYKKNKIFKYLCDHSYNHIAKNRSIYYKLTIYCFGDNPIKTKPYWLIYVFIMVCIFYSLFLFLKNT